MPTVAAIFTSKLRLCHNVQWELRIRWSTVRDSSKNLQLLSELLLNSSALPQANGASCQATELRLRRSLPIRYRPHRPAIWKISKALAMTNHVIMRSFAPLQNLLQADGNHAGA